MKRGGLCRDSQSLMGMDIFLLNEEDIDGDFGEEIHAFVERGRLQ